MGVTDNFDEFVAMYHHKKTDIDMYLALTYILKSENICNKKALDKYCESVGRKMLYNRVQNIAHSHWNKIKHPESSISIRFYSMGYTNSLLYFSSKYYKFK